jgi:hypothetical protein
MNKLPLRLAALITTLFAGVPAWAGDPRFQLYDGIDGVNCKFFNAGGRIAWRHPMGDWRDADGKAQGENPFATVAVKAGGAGRTVEWDVTTLVRGWLEGKQQNSGLLLAPLPGPRSATVAFASREAHMDEGRPRLVVSIVGEAQPKTFAPVADAWLDCSTAYALGARGELRVGDNARSALQFDLAEVAGRNIDKATLALTTLGMQAFGAAIGVFRLDPPVSATAAESRIGIAAAYPRDLGIGKNSDVLFATGFESPSWRSEWSYLSDGSHADRIDRDEKQNFKPFSGHALRVEIAQGDNFGLDMGFDFKDKLGYEPEEVYFRYYLRFAEDWDPTVDGGKLPGLSGTYGKAAWGGRRADPSIGWSMRGHFTRSLSAANPLHGRTAIGTYAYHAAMEGEFGDGWDWTNDGLGVLERNRWYCLEQYFKVNTVGAKDGVLQAWVDGAPAFEKTDVYVRNISSIKIERVWMNVYHGGTAVAARPLHLYIDNVVVAKKPIGCIGR